MEYVALFTWLSMCLVLGGLIHSVTGSTVRYKPLRWLAAPGIMVRKFTMAGTALVTGGTVTHAGMYDMSSRDIDFEAQGPAGMGKVLVPLAPIFGCAVALKAVNAALGAPLSLSYSVPVFATLDVGSFKTFLSATWELLASVVRQLLRMGWRDPKTYLLLGLTFSLAFGASAPVKSLKDAVMGAGLLALIVALLAAMSARHGQGGIMTSPAWFAATRQFLVGTAAVAFVMVVCGVLTALVIGMAVRAYELFAGRKTDSPDQSGSLWPDQGRKRAA